MTAPNEVPPWGFPTGANQPPPFIWPTTAPVASPPPSDPPVPAGVTNTEPVALGGALMSLVSAAFAVLVEFDVWNPTEHQVSLLFLLLTSLITFVTVLARGKASSPATVARLMADKK